MKCPVSIIVMSCLAFLLSGYQALALLGIGLVGPGTGPSIVDLLAPCWGVAAASGIAAGVIMKKVPAPSLMLYVALGGPAVGIATLVLVGMLGNFQPRSIIWLFYAALIVAIPVISFWVGSTVSMYCTHLKGRIC